MCDMAFLHVFIKLTFILDPQLAVRALDVVNMMLFRDVEINQFAR